MAANSDDPKNTKSNDLADRRAFVRLSKSLTVYYKLIKNSKFPKESPKSEEMRASTKDISAGGLAFYLKENIPPLSLVEVRIELPGQATPVVCLAEVVRSRYVENTPFRDTALHFLDISGRDRKVLDQFVHKEAK